MVKTKKLNAATALYDNKDLEINFKLSEFLVELKRVGLISKFKEVIELLKNRKGADLILDGLFEVVSREPEASVENAKTPSAHTKDITAIIIEAEIDNVRALRNFPDQYRSAIRFLIQRKFPSLKAFCGDEISFPALSKFLNHNVFPREQFLGSIGKRLEEKKLKMGVRLEPGSELYLMGEDELGKWFGQAGIKVIKIDKFNLGSTDEGVDVSNDDE